MTIFSFKANRILRMVCQIHEQYIQVYKSWQVARLLSHGGKCLREKAGVIFARIVIYYTRPNVESHRIETRFMSRKGNPFDRRNRAGYGKVACANLHGQLQQRHIHQSFRSCRAYL